MKLAEFDILKQAIQQQVAEGVRSGRYKMDHIPTVQFELGYKFEFENGQIKNLPKQTSPTTDAVWGIKAQFILQADVETKFKELFDENKYLTKELCNAILEGDESRINYFRDVLQRKETGETLYTAAETFLCGVGIDVKEFSFVAGDATIELKRLSYQEVIDKAAEGEIWFRMQELNGFHCRIKIPFKDRQSQSEVQQELRIFEWIVSLLGNGIVRSERVNFYDEDRLGGAGASMSPKKMSRFYYCLTEHRLNLIAKHYMLLRSSIKKASFLEGPTNPAQVAWERYSDAIYYETSQKQISAAIMGLEALYTRKGPELSYSLSMRTNVFLKILGKKDDVREHLKIGYDIRSQYAHGKMESEKTKKKVLKISKTESQFASEVISMLRVSILSSLLLEFGHSSNQSEKFQNDLDNIMAHDRETLFNLLARQELKDVRALISTK